MDRKAQPFPVFDEHLPFSSLLYQIELHIARTVDSPYSYEQLRGPPFSTHLIRPLVRSLEQTRHPAIIAALLAARIDFSVQEDDRAIHEARAYTAELVALRYAGHLPEPELIQFLTYEIPRKNTASSGTVTPLQSSSTVTPPLTEATSLLAEHRAAATAAATADIDIERGAGEDAPYVTESAMGLSALELAILGDAKKFLLSRSVEKVISSIWEGRIVFWDSISVQSKKKASFYNPRRPGNDWYSRLRVPRYRTFFMMVNYAVLLALYYAVLTERNTTRVTALEIALDVWFAGFVYEEIGQVRESGSIRYYASDYWSAFDLAMIVIFLTFFVVRLISVFVPLSQERYAHAAFDVLSLEALLLVPRVFSSLAISPYFGTLLPCLKQMTKDFLKVLVLITILYLGFLTTFSFLGREHFSVNGMAWLLIRVFFGAPYDGLDAASEISPIFGPPLMLVFVILTNILLITVVISILSQRFGKMMNNANEEYMLLFSSSVMESITTSDRVTYFYPPLNLIGILIRPLRLFLNHNEYRNLRIYILKVTHAPFVALLWIYENVRYRLASIREKHSSLLHLRSTNSKKNLWPPQYGSPYAASGRGGRISQGLLVANQVILSGTEPGLARSVFASGEDSKFNNSRSNSFGRANGTGVSNKNVADVAKRRKTRKSAIVSKRSASVSAANNAAERPPLASSASPGSIVRTAANESETAHPTMSPHGLTFDRATTFSTPPKTDAQSSGISAGSDSAYLKQVRRSRIAISLLRDLRRRRSITLPAMPSDERSEVSDITAAAMPHFDGANALATTHAASDLGGDEEHFRLSSLSPPIRSENTTIDGRHEAISGGEDNDFLEDIDDEDEDDINEVDDEDDDDDDFLGLYADQSNIRIRGLEEQVYKMKEMLEHMNAMLVENMQRQQEA
ncbi:hypothetical protein V1517DRAFT_313714 [Lipomyces orientalis]|uniref:Uncharacterized protein n=1 Tax=Lipomyces orientalis TaxID=1233043 RepID=A0ACC3TX37_9ASCO